MRSNDRGQLGFLTDYHRIEAAIVREEAELDELAEVARGIDGKLPSQNTPQAVEFPPSIECLLAADNEMLPSGAPNKWNKRKSMALLQFYGDDEHTDTEDDNSVSSPARRLRLAKKIGVTRSQLNFAQMHL
eukprot:gene7754-8565_t